MKEDKIIDLLLEQGWKECMVIGASVLGYHVRKFESSFKLNGADCQTNDRPPTIQCDIHVWPGGAVLPEPLVQVEFGLYADAGDIWVNYKICAMHPDEAAEKLPVVKELLQKAWNSAN